MKQREISEKMIEEYCVWMHQNEMSIRTIAKYRHYLDIFRDFLDGSGVTKEKTIIWKALLREKLLPATINGALAALNSFFKYQGWEDCIVKLIRVKRRVFISEREELSRDEYTRIVQTAMVTGNERLALMIQTICSTGIRISELSFLTVEAVARRVMDVDCKGKVRTVFLTDGLCERLSSYAEKMNIGSGGIFITKSGKPMDRSNIWREMKAVGAMAGVDPQKVFPHNLRHLFARVYYSQEKDLLRLADILGHSSVNTTRIYTMESGGNHIRQLEKLDFLVKK